MPDIAVRPTELAAKQHLEKGSAMPLPYQDWPSDEHKRWITMGNTFGEHLKSYANDYARDKIPSSISPEARDIAERAIRDTLYGMMMLLDGIPLLPVGNGVYVRYVLTARLQDEQGATVEAIELAPGGDGLCMGFHGWLPENEEPANSEPHC